MILSKIVLQYTASYYFLNHNDKQINCKSQTFEASSVVPKTDNLTLKGHSISMQDKKGGVVIRCI